MIAFTADNHIGVTTQWSIRERGADFMKSFSALVDCIVEEPSATKALIIGGDLFDMAYPPSFAVEFVQSEVRRLKTHGRCSVYGIDGNHDLADGKWLKVCGIEPLTDEPTKMVESSGAGRTVCGIGYRRSSEVLSTLNSMVDRDVKCDILVLHLALGELNRMGAASDVSAREMMPMLKALGVKLVLMGHIHIRQSVEIDGVTFAYCGSTELCSMNEQRDKSFETVDPCTFELTRVPLATRPVESLVIGTEAEFAKFEASIKTPGTLYSMFVVPDVADGVKRLRALAKEQGLMMRVQIMRPDAQAEEQEGQIDRSAGVIGLEQAIGLSFAPDSEEAGLIRAILRSPETLKVTVDGYMKGEEAGDG